MRGHLWYTWTFQAKRSCAARGSEVRRGCSRVGLRFGVRGFGDTGVLGLEIQTAERNCLEMFRSLGVGIVCFGGEGGV